MASTNPYSPRIAVPVFTALFGTMGLAGGLYGFVSPGPMIAQAFGFILPSGTSPSSDDEPTTRQRAYIRIHNIRNFASGVSLLGLTYFYAFSQLSRSSPLVAEALKKCLAASFAIGSIVGSSDGYILYKYASETSDLEDDQKQLAVAKSQGHFFTALPMVALAAGWWFY